MDFTKGYTASFYATFVDPSSWYDIGRFEIVSGTIERTCSDLRQSANLTIREWEYDTDCWIRIYMDTDQNGDRTHTPIFTGIATSPSSNFNNGVTDINLQCYSILKPAEDILLKRGWYALKGSDGASLIKDLLSVTHAPVYIEGDSPSLLSSIIAEDDETNLSMIELILASINWSLRIDGIGNIILSEFSNEPISYFSPDTSDVIETSFSKTNDWFGCPNVLLVTSGEDTYTYKDENPDSRFSIPNRGREVWEIDNDVTISNNESMEAYAKRKLNELQEQTEKVQYARRFLPDIYPDDLVRINYPELQGDYFIESQSINLGAAAKTNESVFRYLDI